MAHFFNKKNLNFPSKRRLEGVEIAHVETKNQKIFAGCRRHILL